MATATRTRLARKETGTVTELARTRTATKTTPDGTARQLEDQPDDEEHLDEVAPPIDGEPEAPQGSELEADDATPPPAPARRGRKPKGHSAEPSAPQPSRVIVLAHLAEHIVETAKQLDIAPRDALFAAESMLIATGEMEAPEEA